MDVNDIATIAKEVATTWGVGTTNVWYRATNSSSFEAKSIAAQFAGYLPDRVLRAVREYAVEHPDKYPTPAVLGERLRTSHRPPDGLRDPDRCDHPQPWGIVSEDDDGNRVGICRWCRTEIVRPAGKFLTEGEIEDRRRRQTEARHG